MIMILKRQRCCLINSKEVQTIFKLIYLDAKSSNDLPNFVEKQLDHFSKEISKISKITQTISIGDESFFSLSIGNRVLKKDIKNSGIPVYSANVHTPFGHVRESNLNDFSQPALLWGIDGIFDWGFIPKGIEFATTDHCGTLYIKDKNLHPKYVYYALKSTKDQYGFDRTYRASLSNMKEVVTVDIPINKKGDFDIEAQKGIADKYERLEKMKASLLEKLQTLSSVQIVLD